MGLQFTHLDDGPLKKIEFNPEVMKTWGVGLWAIFLSLIALIISILFVISRNYIDLGIMQYYLIWATLLVTGIILNTRR